VPYSPPMSVGDYVVLDGVKVRQARPDELSKTLGWIVNVSPPERCLPVWDEKPFLVKNARLKRIV